MAKLLAKATRGIEADRDAAWGRAFDALLAGPSHPRASAFQQLRELTERHMREDADIRPALRRPTWRPPVLHACPASTPRPRERRSAARGRTGAARDDGSGDDGGGGSSDPPPRRKSEHGPRAEIRFTPSSSSRAPRVLNHGRARQ